MFLLYRVLLFNRVHEIIYHSVNKSNQWFSYVSCFVCLGQVLVLNHSRVTLTQGKTSKQRLQKFICLSTRFIQRGDTSTFPAFPPTFSKVSKLFLWIFGFRVSQTTPCVSCKLEELFLLIKVMRFMTRLQNKRSRINIIGQL